MSAHLRYASLMATKRAADASQDQGASRQRPRTSREARAAKSKLDKAMAALKPRERLFVEAYADPRSDTFSNGTGAAGKSSTGLTTSRSKGVAATRLLKTDRVQTAVSAYMEQIGFGPTDRADLTKELALIDTQTITHRDADGNVTHTVETPVPVAARLKAIDVANRVDGTYAKAEAVVDLAKREYEAKLKDLESKLW